MSRKPKLPGDLKVNITIRIKGSLIQELKKIPNYNSLIERLLENYFNEQNK